MANQNVLYIELEDTEPVLDDRTEGILDYIKTHAGTGSSLEEVMETIWTHTETILPHDRIGLSFVEKDGQRVSARYFKTAYESESVHLGSQYSAGLANSTLQEILDSGKGRIIADLEQYLLDNSNSASTKLLLKEGVRSNLTIPLRVDNRPIGFLFFSSRQPDAFQTEHGLILLNIASIISQHLEKVWRIRQLEEVQKDYLSMLGFVSHEMKSPLASMMTIGTTYLKGYMGEVDPLAEKTMKRMMKVSGYLINMVKNYLDLSRLESGEMKFEPKPGILFNRDILSFGIDTVLARAEERGSTFKLDMPDGDIELTGDMDLLRIVAVNLLDNAIKYGDENIEVEVLLKPYAAENEDQAGLMLSVKNKGVGFTKEQAKGLFQRFSRLKQKGTEDRRGTGLGLYLTWWIIQKHNGRILADSEPGQWAEFTVYL